MSCPRMLASLCHGFFFFSGFIEDVFDVPVLGESLGVSFFSDAGCLDVAFAWPLLLFAVVAGD